jgi:D-alanine-D-alanine ligase
LKSHTQQLNNFGAETLFSPIKYMREVQGMDVEKNLSNIQKQLNIAVIFGGSPEMTGTVINRTHNPRSTKTYEYVADDIVDALKKSGYKNVVKLAEGMPLAQALVDKKIDLCWLNSGGTQGMCSISHTPSMLEMLGIPYVGHNPLNAAVLDNKHIFKNVIHGIGLDTAAHLLCKPGSESDEDIHAKLTSVFTHASTNLIVKPVSGRASQHVHHVMGLSNATTLVRDVYEKTGGFVMVEKFLSGREYTMAVMGPLLCKEGKLIKGLTPTAFSPVERILDVDEKIFTSMDIKEITGQRLRLLDKDKADDSVVVKKMAKICESIYTGMGLETCIRVDFRADDSGVLHILEANPKPDLKRPDATRLSFVCAGLSDIDMTYECLIQSMLVNRIHELVTHHPKMAPKLFELVSQ